MIVVAYAIISYRFGDWKRWKEFYPTYLFVILGDITYNFLFYEKPLWEYINFVYLTVKEKGTLTRSTLND